MSQKTTLVGSNSPAWVKNQITARERLLGKNLTGTPFSSDELRYINGKTSFLRLVSGVQISNNVPEGLKIPTRLQALNLDNSEYLDNGLARAFILEGGTTRAIEPEGAADSFVFKSGINSDLLGTSPTLSDSAYGFASDPSYGYSPMPGLISADIKSLNRGSLKEATVKIKCWNPRQFNIIDTLFMKLKGGVFLEWGHSIYTDNDGNVKNNDFTLAHYYLNTDSQQDMYETIKDYRKRSCGNYDGMLAYVKNFKWNLNSDNSYDVDLKLISIGDVIESLKVDVSVNSFPEGTEIAGVEQGSDEQKENPNPLVKYANRTALDQFLAGVYAITGKDDAWYSGEEGEVIIDSVKDLVFPKKSEYGVYFKNFPYIFKQAFAQASGRAEREIIRLEFDEIEEGQEEAYYIKLGTLLRFVQHCFIPKDPEKKETMFGVNHTFVSHPKKADKFNRVALCYTFKGHMSLDPSVCLIPMPEDQSSIKMFLLDNVRQQVSEAGNGNLSDAEVNKIIRDNADKSWSIGNQFEKLQREFGKAGQKAKRFNSKNLGYGFNKGTDNDPSDGSLVSSDFIGFMNHIHVNCAFISRTLTSLLEKKSLNIYEFLTQIMNGIQTALGDVNDFEVVYDSDDNFFYIMDNTQIPGAEAFLQAEPSQDEPPPLPAHFTINLLSRETGLGSFVKSTSMSSEISNNLANEIAISAFPTSPGAKPDANANSMRFAWLNYGREQDRLVKVESIPDQPTEEKPTTSTSEPDYAPVVEKYSRTIELYTEYIKDIADLEYDKDDAEDYRSTLKEIFNLAIQGYETSVTNKAPEDEKGGGTQSRGFIPINLSLVVEGLSGPRIYEKISISNEFLPATYRGNVYFILKGISHTISNGTWETSYETMAVPFTSQDDPELLVSFTEVSVPTEPEAGPQPEPPITPSSDADDYQSLVSGLPHGRPPYSVPNYRYAQGGTGNGAGDGFTIFNKSLADQEKRQIVIHHTAGHPKTGEQGSIVTAQDWSGRAWTDTISTHAIITYDGFVDLLYPDEKTGYHTGAGRNHLNLGIEIQALGYCVEKQGQVVSSASGRALPRWDGTLNKGYTEAVDKWGNPLSFKGYKYFQAYSLDQIRGTIQIIESWIRKYNIQYTYDYNILFPSAQAGSPGGEVYNLWKSGKEGVYTHNSMKGSAKWDIFPQREMLIALRDLALKLKAEGKAGCNGDVTTYPGKPNGFNPFV